MTDIPGMVERVRDAISNEPDLWVRVNKFSDLPFEVVDRSGEPVVLSAWANAEDAHEARHCAATDRQARAAIAAHEAALRDAGMVIVRKADQ